MLQSASFNYVVVDHFLPEADLAELLDFSLRNEDAFEPATVGTYGQTKVKAEKRLARRCHEDLGQIQETFERAICARLDGIFTDLGIPPFPVASLETELVAHEDGGFFELHIDSFTNTNRAVDSSDRVISAVYYFYREPKSFTGGELLLHPLLPGGEPNRIDPALNRLVLFPSFAPHEVLPVANQSREFANSRFSINCWIRRRKT